MRKLIKLSILGWTAASLAVTVTNAPSAATAEWNATRIHPVAIDVSTDRLIVGFKATPANTVTRAVPLHGMSRTVMVREAQTHAEDLAGLLARHQIASRGARQLTPSLHLILLSKTVNGTELGKLLAGVRADTAVEFAEIDARRYVHALPNDPLFQPGATNTGQWYMLTPTTALPTSDWSATDAVSAWNITTGSPGTVIADIDSGFRFDHPDLLRAGFGGRLLPGYDFVGEDLNASNGMQLGTFLIANDGDGWDPDPSDPGDWINAGDQTNTALFPSSKCPVEDSSWHGTRVAGVLGAITNNGVGVAGMTWNPYILPVRALGKCGGYDSDIITAMQWAAGLAVPGVPDNPYPADIINLSLGGTGSCPSSYATVISRLNAMGVLIVASAGNASGPVDTPGNCPGVLAVGGLRNVGTKVGYSSLGPEVGISAPAGNCVNSSGSACLRSIDTTVNEGLTTPGANSYTDQINPNLGTSFSAPIVSGVAALMRAVNANLTPAQLISRIKSSASAFPPNTTGVATCPNTGTGGECACTTSECGAGMLNALSAVQAAQNPIAAVKIPATLAANSNATFDGSGSVAACNRTIASYAWTATGGVSIQGAANAGQVQTMWNGTAGTLVLTVTDGNGASDTATVAFGVTGATSSAPASAGLSTTACPKPLNFSVSAPTVSVAFSPASVGMNTASTLTLRLNNTNPFELTQASITESLPAGMSIAPTPALATDCTGADLSLSNTSSTVSLSNANIPAQGSCTVTINVQAAAAGSYAESIADKALTTGPAGASSGAASASLTVSAPAKSGGGGAVDWLDVMLVTGVLLAARGQRARRLYNRGDE